MPPKNMKPMIDEDDEEDQIVAPVPVVKTKKERTPAQKEAFSRALSILKEKREAVKTVEKEKYEKADAAEKDRIVKEKYEKAKNHKVKLPPAPSYVTMGDLEKFKLDLLSALPKEKPVAVVEKPVPIVEKPAPVVEKPAPVVVKPAKQLTGHDLLDKLFFS